MRLLPFLLLTLLLGCASTFHPRPDPPTPDQVVEMSKAGKSADEIIQLMQDSGAIYRLSASQLSALRDKGVPDAVIDYMQQTYLEQVRRDEAWRYSYPPHWGYWYYPYPYYWHRYPYWYWW